MNETAKISIAPISKTVTLIPPTFVPIIAVLYLTNTEFNVTALITTAPVSKTVTAMTSTFVTDILDPTTLSSCGSYETTAIQPGTETGGIPTTLTTPNYLFYPYYPYYL